MLTWWHEEVLFSYRNLAVHNAADWGIRQLVSQGTRFRKHSRSLWQGEWLLLKEKEEKNEIKRLAVGTSITQLILWKCMNFFAAHLWLNGHGNKIFLIGAHKFHYYSRPLRLSYLYFPVLIPPSCVQSYRPFLILHRFLKSEVFLLMVF